MTLKMSAIQGQPQDSAHQFSISRELHQLLTDDLPHQQVQVLVSTLQDLGDAPLPPILKQVITHQLWDRQLTMRRNVKTLIRQPHVKLRIHYNAGLQQTEITIVLGLTLRYHWILMVDCRLHLGLCYEPADVVKYNNRLPEIYPTMRRQRILRHRDLVVMPTLTW